MKLEDNDINYAISILKTANGNSQSCQRFNFAYNNPINGEGHFIHTYKCDGDPLPSFEGEPKLISIPDDLDEFANLLWDSLNEENKVSLFVRYIDLKSNEVASRIINKNK